MNNEIKAIVVDDELTALGTFLAHVVDQYNCSFRPFNNRPLEAIEYVKRNKIDVAFLDINMDVIDGVSLAVELIKVDPDIRIIFITGYASDEEKIKGILKDNLLGFCYKPYNMNVFERLIMRVKEIRDKKREVFIKTFGPFDIFVENIPVQFSSSKSKELFAFLVDNNGSIVTMNSVICAL